MKICIISSYPPEKEGVGQFTKRLVDNFDAKEIKPFVLTFDYKFKYSEKNIFQVLGASPGKFFKTYFTLKSINPDIIHLQYATPIYRIYSLLLWSLLCIYKKNNTVNLIVTFHEVGRETELLKIPGIKYYSLMSFIADHIIVHTEEAKKILIKKCNVSTKKISRIPLGLYDINLNLTNNSVLQTINNIDITNKKIILFFGYIHPDKGIDTLIKAINILYHNHPEENKKSVVLIAGDVRPRKGFFKYFGYLDQRYKNKLINLVKNFKLENNIKFLGYIKEENIASLINSSSVIVMPYKKVEQSGVLNLALNFNIPVIASDIGGLKEILSETNLTVKPENPRLLQKKIYFILVNKKIININIIFAKIRTKNSLKSVINNHILIYSEGLKLR
jgi:glycosyltransferase involved in cell wall biosynthesis